MFFFLFFDPLVFCACDFTDKYKKLELYCWLYLIQLVNFAQKQFHNWPTFKNTTFTWWGQLYWYLKILITLVYKCVSPSEFQVKAKTHHNLSSVNPLSRICIGNRKTIPWDTWRENISSILFIFLGTNLSSLYIYWYTIIE